jgi:hypothetical protein
MKNLFRIGFTLLILSSCKAKSDPSLNNKLDTKHQISDIIFIGVTQYLPFNIDSNARTKFSDFRIVDSYDLPKWYHVDTIDSSLLVADFFHNNELKSGEKILSNIFPDSLMIRKTLVDSIRSTTQSASGFWEILNGLYPNIGLIDLTSPQISDDGNHSFFGFSYQRGSRNGARYIVWLKHNGQEWRVSNSYLLLIQ